MFGRTLATVGLLFPHAASAQTYTITSITTTDLGNVAAAASGSTVFRVDPGTGIVTKVSGNGARISTASTRSLITIACGNQNACNTDTPKLVIAQTGTPTNRANAATNFTLSTTGATGTINTAPGTGNTITATLGPIGKNLSKTIYAGMDATYSGDNSVAATGSANTSFAVTVTNKSGAGAVSSSGVVTAKVFRTLTISIGTPLAFGRVSRPRTGTGTVSLSAGGAAVAVTGDGTAAIANPVPTSAILSASGEGGQALTITVPATFTMANGASTITVTTDAINAGAQVLDGSAGSAGTKVVTVGGSFPLTSATTLGAYSGTFVVTFQYN